MDIQLTQWQILSMIAVMLLTSKGAAGVTGSGFAALVATLAAMPDTVPVAGVVIIAGIDRFMSEARALTSLCSNAVACVVVASWEGALDKAVLKRELDGGYARSAGRDSAGGSSRLKQTGNLAPPVSRSRRQNKSFRLARRENYAMTTRKSDSFGAQQVLDVGNRSYQHCVTSACRAVRD